MLLSIADAVSAVTLTMEQAVKLALKQNEDLLVAKTQLDKADAEVKNAVASALPHLDISSSFRRNHEIPTAVFGGMEFKLGTTNNISIDLTLNQTIYQGGRVFTALSIARLYRKYVDYTVQEAEAEIVFGVRQAFLGAILARNIVEVRRDAVETAELNLEMVNKMHEQGIVSEFEVLRAEVELANLEPLLIQAENQAVIAEDQLQDLIGLEMDEEIDLVYDFDPTQVGLALSENDLQQAAKSERPLLQEREYLQKINKEAIGIAKAGRRPNLSISSGLNWTYQEDDLDLAFNDFTRSWSTTLFLTMPLFDGFATSAEIRKARLDHHASELQFEQARDQVELAVREAFLHYQESGKRLRAQSKTVEQAEEGLRIARLRYQNGVGTQLEVMAAETAVTQARTNYVQATHDAALAVYRLLRVTGVEDFEQLEEQ
jgi:outer membrane protein TolC